MTPKFLLDENVEKQIVDFMASEGLDIMCVADECPGCSDDGVFELARSSHRILITNDTDFGEFIFRRREISSGVVLMRFASESVKKKIEVLRHLLKHHSAKLYGHFALLNERQIKIKPLSFE